MADFSFVTSRLATGAAITGPLTYKPWRQQLSRISLIAETTSTTRYCYRATRQSPTYGMGYQMMAIL